MIFENSEHIKTTLCHCIFRIRTKLSVHRIRYLQPTGCFAYVDKLILSFIFKHIVTQIFDYYSILTLDSVQIDFRE